MLPVCEQSSMILGAKSNALVNDIISNKTFVGIDFGTSTTVVSVIRQNKDGVLYSEPLQIAQPDSRGGFSEQEIVNTVLAWVKNSNSDGELIFGKTAYELKSTLKIGKNVFSSFKMDLGLDLGPTYPDTELSKKNNNKFTIENAKDATFCFFSLLKKAIETAISKEKLPNNIEYAISVPASFLANQRKDLLDSLHKAGISVTESCLIDEPNAAFLSYFYESIVKSKNTELLEILKDKGVNVLVYDFGAGTCDISILNVSLDSFGLNSRNVSISKFTALGGDNIDRDIAYLLAKRLNIEAPQGFILPENAYQTIISRLMPIAESLKISMINWLTTQGVSKLDQIRLHSHNIQASEQSVFKNKKENINITVIPSLNVFEFHTILSKYLDLNDIENNIHSVCSPILDAVKKSGLSTKDLYGVLFIGGSCENQFVRNCVMEYLPNSVKAIIPSDLRTHVSRGAALHSVGYHGFSKDFIEPIVSEDINIVIFGDNMKCLVKASTPVPSDEFTLELQPQYDGQKTVEIPVCLSDQKQLLGCLEFSSEKGFRLNNKIFVTGKITRDKTIEIKARVDSKEICSKNFNPLSTKTITEFDEEYLKALKKYRQDRLSYGAKKIPPSTIKSLIATAKKLRMFSEVAEYMVELETLYDEYATVASATNISYYASRAGKYDLCSKYAKIAVTREENECTCYNYSLELDDSSEKIKWLRKSLSYDDSYVASLISLGNILSEQKKIEGPDYLLKAYNILKREFEEKTISSDDLNRLEHLCKSLGISETLSEIISYRDSAEFTKVNRLTGKMYNESSLVVMAGESLKNSNI